MQDQSRSGSAERQGISRLSWDVVGLRLGWLTRRCAICHRGSSRSAGGDERLRHGVRVSHWTFEWMIPPLRDLLAVPFPDLGRLEKTLHASQQLFGRRWLFQKRAIRAGPVRLRSTAKKDVRYSATVEPIADG